MTVYLKRHAPNDGDWSISWQALLAGEDLFEGHFASNFGPKSEAATKSAQKAWGLAETGIVDSGTLGHALGLGFDPPDSWLKAALAANDVEPKLYNKLLDGPDEDVKRYMADGQPYGYMDPTWPQPTDLDGDGRGDLTYLNSAGRQALFGPLEYTVGADGKPKVTNNWYADNVVRVMVPQLVGVDVYGNKGTGRVLFHRAAVPQLLGALQEIEDAGLLDLILSFGGSYVMRFIRGSTKTLSNHAFAVAVDFNMKQNGLGKQPALVGELGTIRPLAPIFERWGFFSGIWYRNRKDGMHFECVKVFDENTLCDMVAQLEEVDHILPWLEAA